MKRVLGAALLLVTSFAVVGASSPAASAADEPTAFTSRWIGIDHGRYRFSFRAQERTGKPPLLQLVISESNSGTDPMFARRRITYSHVGDFEADLVEDTAALAPTSRQIGDHGEIEMKWVHDGPRHIGHFEGTFQIEVMLGSRRIELNRTTLPGTLHRLPGGSDDDCAAEGRTIHGTIAPDGTQLLARANDGRATIHAERRGADTPSGWKTFLEVDSRLGYDDFFLDGSEQHGFIRGRPGSYLAHASTYTAPSPGEDGPWVECELSHGELGSVTHTTHGSLTPSTDEGPLEVRWINSRRSQLVGDGITAERTRTQPPPI